MQGESNDNSERGKTPKRSYQAPRIEETGEFERLVLTCTHQPGGDPACTVPIPPFNGVPTS